LVNVSSGNTLYSVWRWSVVSQTGQFKHDHFAIGIQATSECRLQNRITDLAVNQEERDLI